MSSPKRAFSQINDAELSSKSKHGTTHRNLTRPRDLRPVKVLSSGSVRKYGQVMTGRMYQHGQVVLVRQNAISFHSDLIHSAQPATDIPVSYSCWGLFGNNYDFHSANTGDHVSNDLYELLAVSPEGKVLLIVADSSMQSRLVEEFDKHDSLQTGAHSSGKVTAVLIASPGVYLLATSIGDIYRLKRQGRILQVDQLQSPVVSDWFSAIRETGKKYLLPALQAALGSSDTGDSANVHHSNPIMKLILIPNSPYLLACGDRLALWSNWEKGVKEQPIVWMVELKSLIQDDLNFIRDKTRGSANDEMGIGNSLANSRGDRYSFGAGSTLGKVQLVDFALLHDSHDSSWGTLAILVLLTPQNGLSSNLWIYTAELADCSSCPSLKDRTFLSSCVSNITFPSSICSIGDLNDKSGSVSHPSPSMYTLLPSWRVYLSWVSMKGKVVLGQIDVKTISVLSEALFGTEDIDVGHSRDSLIISAPGITSMCTDIPWEEVAAIQASPGCSASASTSRSSSSRQKVDGLLLLVQSDESGKLVEALPPLGNNALCWAVAPSHSLSLRDQNDLQKLLWSLCTNSIDEALLAVGAVRDAISTSSLAEVCTSVQNVSKMIVDRDLSRMDGYRSVNEDLKQRRQRHSNFVEILAEAGLMKEESIMSSVKLAHESIYAAALLCSTMQQMQLDASSSTGFTKHAAESGLRVFEQAMSEYIQTFMTASVVDASRNRGYSLEDIFFSRPTSLGDALTAIDKALEAQFQMFYSKNSAFSASFAVASLFKSSLEGAAHAVREVVAAVDSGSLGTELSIFGAQSDVRAATASILESLLRASFSQSDDWLKQDVGSQQCVSEQVSVLFELTELALENYAAEAALKIQQRNRQVTGTTHMSAAWQIQQHTVKKMCADILLALRRYSEAYDLCSTFLILEGIMEAAIHLRSQFDESQISESLVKLFASSGSVVVKALPPAAASTMGGSHGTHLTLRDISLAEYVFLWIEQHHPDHCALLLELESITPAIFEQFVSRAAESAPTVRSHFAWMAALQDLETCDTARYVHDKVLNRASNRAYNAAIESVDVLSTSEAVASIAKLTAYADDKYSMLMPDGGHGQVFDASNHHLMVCSVQRIYFPGKKTLIGDTPLVDEMLRLCLAGTVETHACLVDCIKVLSSTAEGITAVRQCVRKVWITAFAVDGLMRQLCSALASDGLTAMDEEYLVGHSHMARLVENILSSQQYTEFHELGLRLNLDLIPSGDRNIHRLAVWEEIWAGCESPPSRVKALIEAKVRDMVEIH